MGFGSSKSKQESSGTSASSNLSYPFLQNQLGDQVSQTSTSNNAIANLLGLNGASGSRQGFDDFRNSGAYNFQKEEGINGITGNAATRGLLNSGSTARGVAGFSSNLASQWLDKYLAQLGGLSDSGIKSAGVIANAGQVSNSSNKSSGTSKNFNFSTG